MHPPEKKWENKARAVTGDLKTARRFRTKLSKTKSVGKKDCWKRQKTVGTRGKSSWSLRRKFETFN